MCFYCGVCCLKRVILPPKFLHCAHRPPFVNSVDTSPPNSRTVCEAVVQLCLHLNISPPVLLDLLLDRKPGASGVKMGEPFYRNYKESIIRACKFQFEEYALACSRYLENIESSSGIVATDIVISVMELATRKRNPHRVRAWRLRGCSAS